MTLGECIGCRKLRALIDDRCARCLKAAADADAEPALAALAVALEWIDMRCDVTEFPEAHALIVAALTEHTAAEDGRISEPEPK